MSFESTFDARIQASLVSAAARGDAGAIEEIYDSTFTRVYAFAFRLARNHEDAEDITSETYERAFRNLHRFESGDVPLIVWLIRIARNVGHEQLRDRASTQTVELSPEVADRLIDETTNPERATIDLSLLTPAQRDVMALRLAGFKIREIAATLGKAEGTVKALQFAAAKRLREVMRP